MFQNFRLLFILIILTFIYIIAKGIYLYLSYYLRQKINNFLVYRFNSIYSIRKDFKNYYKNK